MIGTFPGKLALAEGEEVDVDLEIAGGRLRLTTGVSEIGSWPIESCEITPAEGGYRLTLDGEGVSFRPDHPDAFAAVAGGMASTETPPTAPRAASAGASTSAFDLEAALDQVLGGGEDYTSIVPDESADDIAVTLEALFATAYPEFDTDEDDFADQPSDTSTADSDADDRDRVASTPDVSAQGAAEPDEAVARVEGADHIAGAEVEVVANASDEPADAESSVSVFDTTASSSETAPEASDDWLQPSIDADHTADPAVDERAAIDASGWSHASTEVPEWEPQAAADPTVEDAEEDVEKAFDIENLDRLLGVSGGAEHGDTEYGAADPAGDTAHPGDFDDVDALLDASREDSQEAIASEDAIYHAEEPDLDVASEVEPDALADAIGFDLSSRAAADAPHVDDVEPAVSETDIEHVRYEAEAPAYRDRVEAEEVADALNPAASFDLDGAVSGVGYAEPVEVEEPDVESAAARRSSGMFSKTATERFASVAGAMRDRAAAGGDGGVGGDGGNDEADDGEMSVADQIMASQEQLRSGAKVRRFTPALVKKLTIGFVILFVIAGIALSTPAIIRYLADQVTDEQAQPPATTLPQATTVPSTPGEGAVTTTTVDEQGSTDGEVPSFVAAPVLDLGSADFVERWDSIAGRVSSQILIGREIPADTSGLGFTEFLGLEWSFDDDGTLAWYRLVLDPRGDATDDALGLQALGVAINVAEPDLSGSDLRTVMAELGLDVEDPTLDLDGSVVRDGARYRLQYEEGRGLITMTIESASAAASDEVTDDAPETTTP